MRALSENGQVEELEFLWHYLGDGDPLLLRVVCDDIAIAGIKKGMDAGFAWCARNIDKWDRDILGEAVELAVEKPGALEPIWRVLLGGMQPDRGLLDVWLRKAASKGHHHILALLMQIAPHPNDETVLNIAMGSWKLPGVRVALMEYVKETKEWWDEDIAKRMSRFQVSVIHQYTDPSPQVDMVRRMIRLWRPSSTTLRGSRHKLKAHYHIPPNTLGRVDENNAWQSDGLDMVRFGNNEFDRQVLILQHQLTDAVLKKSTKATLAAVKAGADMRYDSMHALRLACYLDATNVVILLSELGADPTANQCQCLALAIMHSNDILVAYLKPFGTHIDPVIAAGFSHSQRKQFNLQSPRAKQSPDFL
jgi:hypothetical protein